MRKLGASVVMGGMLLGTIAAHAAPSLPGPTPTARPVGPRVVIAPRNVEVEVLSTTNKCKEHMKARVALRNKTQQPWAGVINFVAGGSTSKPVALAGSGEDATKTIDVVGPVRLDCSKPIGTQGIRVWKNGEANAPLLVQVLKPKKVSGLRDLSGGAPPSSDTKVWLRRVTFEATCGGNVTATAMLHSFGSLPQEAKTRLGFGIYVKEGAVEVRVSTPVQYGAPHPLDCNAENGLPAFEYSLLNGHSATGQIDDYEVTFEPST